jgi:putative phosphonate metabolism protein
LPFVRYAICFTPGPDDPLTEAAERWLGRSVFVAERPREPALAELRPKHLAALVEEPGHYGFHATLVAPFRLAAGATGAAVADTLSAFCACRTAIEIPYLVIARIGAFYALVPDGSDLALSHLAADAVHAFDRFRAPLTPAESEKRRPDALTLGQQAHLERWGYPFVFDEFRFHMTLTGPTRAGERARIEHALHGWFDLLLNRPVSIGHISLFLEPAPGKPFRCEMRVPLRPARALR